MGLLSRHELSQDIGCGVHTKSPQNCVNEQTCFCRKVMQVRLKTINDSCMSSLIMRSSIQCQNKHTSMMTSVTVSYSFDQEVFI